MFENLAPRDNEFCEIDYAAKFVRGTTSDKIDRSTWVINTNDLDSYNSVIPPDNGDLAAYRNNPVVLINHNYDRLAGHSVVSRRGKSDKARIEATMRDGDRIEDGGDWDLHDDVVARFYRKVQAGLMRGASIGFRARWERVLRDGADPDKFESWFWRAVDWTLMEWSIVTVPANPSALKTSRMLKRMGREIPETPTAILVPTAIGDIDFASNAQASTLTIASTNPNTIIDVAVAVDPDASPDEGRVASEPPHDDSESERTPDESNDAESTSDERVDESSEAIVIVPTETIIKAAMGDANALRNLQTLVHIYGTRD